jgi:hypothetical protein
MKFVKFALALAVASTSFAAVPALSADVAGAATSDCTCISPPALGGSIGSVAARTGDVRKSEGARFVRVSKPIMLSDGSQIAVGGNGIANLAAGSSCRLSLGAYQFATVSGTLDGQVCVKVSRIDPAAFAALAGGALSPLVFAGGAAILGVGGVLLIGQGGTKLSQ